MKRTPCQVWANNLKEIPVKERGAKIVITTTPRYDSRTFGTNMTEAMLTAYAGKGRRLSDELGLKSEVMRFLGRISKP